MTQEENKKELEFKNCKTVGDKINALVMYFTNNLLGDFILEQALKEVKDNNKKIADFKESLFSDKPKKLDENLKIIVKPNKYHIRHKYFRKHLSRSKKLRLLREYENLPKYKRSDMANRLKITVKQLTVKMYNIRATTK